MLKPETQSPKVIYLKSISCHNQTRSYAMQAQIPSIKSFVLDLEFGLALHNLVLDSDVKWTLSMQLWGFGFQVLAFGLKSIT